jgi:hypothetical protein
MRSGFEAISSRINGHSVPYFFAVLKGIVPMGVMNWIDRPANAWLLFCVSALVLFYGTGSLPAAVILTALEIGLWTSVRYFRKRLRQHR